MNNRLDFICAVVALFLIISVAVASARKRNLKGTIIAYDPVHHSLKQPSFVKNLEVTIADIGRTPSDHSFIKLTFEGFGTQQVADDVLAGRTPFRVRAIRDTSCDEDHPHVLSDMNSFQGSGTFLLNETHRMQSLDGISRLECYRVQVGK